MLIGNDAYLQWTWVLYTLDWAETNAGSRRDNQIPHPGRHYTNHDRPCRPAEDGMRSSTSADQHTPSVSIRGFLWYTGLSSLYASAAKTSPSHQSQDNLAVATEAEAEAEATKNAMSLANVSERASQD